MSWAEALKINSNMKVPLDKLSSRFFYDLAVVANKGYGDKESDVTIIPYGKEELYSNVLIGGTMKVVVCPETLKVFGGNAFYNCENLESVLISEGLEELNVSAFYNCPNLKTIRLPRTIKTIHGNAFLHSNLTDIYVAWSEGEVAGAPWGATEATIHYNS